MTIIIITMTFFPMEQQPPVGPGPPHYRGFTITLRQTTIGRTPLEGWSPQSRYLCLTTHKHSQQTSTPLAVFEPAIPTSERRQTHVSDRAATGIVDNDNYRFLFCRKINCVVCLRVGNRSKKQAKRNWMNLLVWSWIWSINIGYPLLQKLTYKKAWAEENTSQYLSN
jgi:hypothetical protein